MTTFLTNKGKEMLKTVWMSRDLNELPTMDDVRAFGGGMYINRINAHIRQKASDSFSVQEKETLMLAGDGAWEAAIHTRLFQLRAQGIITDEDLR